jgi:hypothetical protein
VCLETVIKKHIQKLITFLPRAIADGQHSGQFFPDIHPMYAALALSSMVNFYFIVKPLADQILPQEVDRDEEYIRQALMIYLNGVRQREQGNS